MKCVRDLWAGADVRWKGPETTRKQVRLHPGDRAVVINAGRHQVASFSSLYSTAGTRRPGPRRGVVIQLASGEEVTVSRRHLELVPPDHPLAPEADGTLASWWLEQLDPNDMMGLPVVGSLVPSSLPAVCQVLHPWWVTDTEQISWRKAASQLGFRNVPDFDSSREMFSIPAAADAGLSSSPGALDTPTATALIDILMNATRTPEDVFVAVWQGWGDVPTQRFPGAARVPTPGRGHFLLRGPLTGTLSSVAVRDSGQPATGLWWPADQAWFVATEIEFEWTFVAGDPTLMENLLSDDRLEAASTSFDAPANRAAAPR